MSSPQENKENEVISFNEKPVRSNRGKRQLIMTEEEKQKDDEFWNKNNPYFGNGKKHVII